MRRPLVSGPITGTHCFAVGFVSMLYYITSGSNNYHVSSTSLEDDLAMMLSCHEV